MYLVSLLFFSSSDIWGLGCLIWEAFNGPLKTQPALKTVDSIPKQLSTLYYELVSANPASRPNPADIITRCVLLCGTMYQLTTLVKFTNFAEVGTL